MKGWIALMVALLLAGPAWAGDKQPGGELTDVFFTTSKIGYTVGKGGVVFRTADAGKTWEPQPTGVPIDLHSVYFTGTHIGWACGDNGLLLHTEDGGQTWTKQPLEGAGEVSDTLHRVVFIGPENGWICGDHGLLLHSEDAGKTWQVVPSATRHDLQGMVWTDSLEGWIV
ncbi:MAG TPA: YCF48-related protein, partial [Candidatus Xenobia bacterium]